MFKKKKKKKGKEGYDGPSPRGPEQHEAGVREHDLVVALGWEWVGVQAEEEPGQSHSGLKYSQMN